MIVNHSVRILAMNEHPTSTIAALCYAKKSDLDFRSLVDELGQALSDHEGISCTKMSKYEDFVVFDLTTVRICLAYADFGRDFPDLPEAQRYASAVVVSIGSSPESQERCPLFLHRQDVCRGLVERIEAQHTSDRFLWLELHQVFDENVFDTVLEKIWPVLAEAAAEEEYEDVDIAPEPLVATAAKASRKRAPQVDPDSILPTLERRFDAELEARMVAGDEVQTNLPKPVPTRPRATHPAANADMPRRGREVPAPTEIDLPDFDSLSPFNEGAFHASVRSALYDPLEASTVKEAIAERSVQERAAIYAVNASVVALSLPVGVAMMAYSALAKEDFNTSARALAVTGALIGIAQTSIGNGVLSFLV
jgi:hypothetical protein